MSLARAHIAKLSAAAALCWALVPGISAAQQGALTIDADTAELDEPRGVSIYRGNVKLEQGGLSLSGETLTIAREGGNNNHLIATVEGDAANPANLTQQATPQQPRVEATARSMAYDTQQRILTITGGARILRGEDRITAEKIVYDLARQRVRASGGGQGTGGASGGRVRITIPAPNSSDLPGSGLDQLREDFGAGAGSNESDNAPSGRNADPAESRQ